MDEVENKTNLGVQYTTIRVRSDVKARIKKIQRAFAEKNGSELSMSAIVTEGLDARDAKSNPRAESKPPKERSTASNEKWHALLDQAMESPSVKTILEAMLETAAKKKIQKTGT